jgi:hypothetical protein
MYNEIILRLRVTSWPSRSPVLQYGLIFSTAMNVFHRKKEIISKDIRMLKSYVAILGISFRSL